MLGQISSHFGALLLLPLIGLRRSLRFLFASNVDKANGGSVLWVMKHIF